MPASSPTCAMRPGCRKSVADRPEPAAFRPRPEKLSKMILERLVEIADEESEEADIERLLDEPGDDVFVPRERPEEARERDVDRDQRRARDI